MLNQNVGICFVELLIVLSGLNLIFEVCEILFEQTIFSINADEVELASLLEAEEPSWHVVLKLLTEVQDTVGIPLKKVSN